MVKGMSSPVRSAAYHSLLLAAGRHAAGLGDQRPPRVIVKVRYAPSLTETHGVRLSSPSSEALVIQQAAAEALGRRPVRLLGVRAEFAVDQSS